MSDKSRDETIETFVRNYSATVIQPLFGDGDGEVQRRLVEGLQGLLQTSDIDVPQLKPISPPLDAKIDYDSLREILSMQRVQNIYSALRQNKERFSSEQGPPIETYGDLLKKVINRRKNKKGIWPLYALSRECEKALIEHLQDKGYLPK